MRKPLLAANWKMNGNVELLQAMQQSLLALNAQEIDTVICPPFIFLPSAQSLFAHSFIAYGAQDVSNEEEGAYTGQISAKMLSQLACQYAIIGHCERRRYCAENDTVIAQKCQKALVYGLTPILCVGENLLEREQGKTEQVVLTQLKAVLDSFKKEDIEKLVIAYEPVWAIGTGQAASPELAQVVHQCLRECVASYDEAAAKRVRILYGGSANAENLAEFLAEQDIDGALIGGASLKVETFTKMVGVARALCTN